jgi:hypothetical protein
MHLPTTVTDMILFIHQKCISQQTYIINNIKCNANLSNKIIYCYVLTKYCYLSMFTVSLTVSACRHCKNTNTKPDLATLLFTINTSAISKIVQLITLWVDKSVYLEKVQFVIIIQRGFHFQLWIDNTLYAGK